MAPNLMLQPRPSRFPPVSYTKEEQETWSILIRRFWEMIPEYMCRDYLDGFDRMDFPLDRIPLLAGVEAQLQKFSGWQIERVNGLIPNDEFYGLFAQKKFPSNDFIRARKDIDYTPSPDIFHEIVGHVPMLTNPFFGDFTHHVGQFATKVMREYGADKLTPIARIYWFTLEFGLIDTDEGVRIFGAGFAPGEMRHALTSAVEKRPFIVDEVARTAYNYWEMQNKLFVIKSFDDMVAQFDNWCAHFDPDVDYGQNPNENGNS